MRTPLLFCKTTLFTVSTTTIRRRTITAVALLQTPKETMRIQVALLLLLSATALCVDPDVHERNKKFINQHVNGKMSVDRCTDEIKNRKIKTKDNECKETNTFILSTTNHINAICGKAGEPYGQMTKSQKPFPIIICKLRNRVRPPRCEYRGQAQTRYIVIKCESGYPVHFDGDIVALEK